MVTEDFDMVKHKDPTSSKKVQHLHLRECWKKLFLGILFAYACVCISVLPATSGRSYRPPSETSLPELLSGEALRHAGPRGNFEANSTFPYVVSGITG